MKQRPARATEWLRNWPYGSGVLFYVLLVVTLVHYLIRRISWQTQDPAVKAALKLIKTISREALLWTAAAAFGFFAASLLTAHLKKKRVLATALIAVPLGALTGFGLTWLLDYSGSIFDVAVAMITLLSAVGRDFDRIARVYLWTHIAGLAFAGAGIPLGLTQMIIKDGSYGMGLGLGLTHPNLWAREVLMLLFIVWYLYGRGRALRTLLIFVAPTAALYGVTRCRTVVLLAGLFLLAALCQSLWEKPAGDGYERPEAGLKKWIGRLYRGLLAAMPLIGLLVTLILALNMEAVVRLTYGTPLQNTAKRFVQAGIALERYGFKFFGQTVSCADPTAVILAGQKEYLYVLDNGYIGEGIQKGAFYLAVMLALQMAAGIRAIAGKKTGLLLIGAAMALMTLMERSPLVIAYNFLLLYPLSAVTGEAASPETARTESE